MNPELHAKAKEVFLAAFTMSGRQRTDYLDTVCDSQELKEEVLSLLGYGDECEVREPELAERFLPGTLIAKRYRIVCKLGAGAAAEVFRADDLELGLPVALKFLSPGMTAEWVGRFKNEVRLARQVTHSHVCRVYDIGEWEGHHFISMEFVDGEDLGSLLRRVGFLPQEKAVEIASQLCSGLAAAHSRGIIHRDLKPGNILVDGRGKVKIADFGIAAPLSESDMDVVHAGTPGYMAPEAWGGPVYTPQTDLYSLGLILYDVVAGLQARRFAGPTQTLVPPSNWNQSLDPAFERFILWCAESNPEDRPGSASIAASVLPGYDPVRAALESGDTPSPEMIAESNPDGELRKAIPLTFFFGAIALLMMLLTFSGSGLRLAGADLNKSPDVLVDRAQQILREIGYSDPPGDIASGFVENIPVAPGSPKAVFWYRQSVDAMEPTSSASFLFGRGRVDLDDPALNEEGMVLMLLSPAGDLLYLEIVPAFLDPVEPVERVPDWPKVLDLAGIKDGQVESSAPNLVPAVYADERRAWRVASPNGLLHEINAASFRGRPVYVSVDRVTDEPSREEELFDAVLSRLTLSGMSGLALSILLLIIAIPLATRNWGAMRENQSAAFRLAITVLGVNLSIWVFGASHILEFEAEMYMFLAALTASFSEAAQVWILYTALEPYARRYVPETLVSWNRLLKGRFIDPLIGRDILVGTATGIYLAFILRVDSLLPPLLGLDPAQRMIDPLVLDSLLGGRVALSVLSELMLIAVYEGLVLLLLFVFFRRWLGRGPKSMLLLSLIALPLFIQLGEHPVLSWLVIGLGFAFVFAWVLSRYGLVAAALALFVQSLLISYPVTLDVSRWYIEVSFGAVSLVLALLGLGFFLSTRSQQRFSGPGRAGQLA